MQSKNILELLFVFFKKVNLPYFTNNWQYLSIYTFHNPPVTLYVIILVSNREVMLCCILYNCTRLYNCIIIVNCSK